MYHRSQRVVTDEHRPWNVGASVPLVQEWQHAAVRFRIANSRLASATSTSDPARAYTLSRSLADKCAPVSNSSPVRKAQNIRLADRAKGP